MHRLLVSEGIVLGKRNTGEAHILASILTRDFGLLRAKATSTRRENSKLRYGLEQLTLGRFSFVEGRYEWKLVGAEAELSGSFAPEAGKRAAAGRICALILRLVRGEERAPALFENVKEGFAGFARAESGEELRGAECVLVLRILESLGYLPADAGLAPFLGDSQFSKELAAEAHAARPYLVRAINESLSHTGL